MNRFVAIGVTLGLAMASPSLGATLAFTGQSFNSNLPAALGGRCSALTVTIANGPFPLVATGTSNFGDFTFSQSHCLDSGPPIAAGATDVPYYDGLFTYTFADGKTLSGTYDGVLSNSGVTGVVDNVQHFIITGGTGLFANATGSFLGTGQVHFAGGPPAATLTISDGLIKVAAVPEPASWSLLLGGFGAIGAAMRRRQRTAVRTRSLLAAFDKS